MTEGVYLTSADIEWFTDYLAYYLSETAEELTDWDCKHLAQNMIQELKIVRPDWERVRTAVKER